MAVVFIILIVSLSLNAVFFYLSKSWKIHFSEKLSRNNFFEGDSVNIKIERHFGRLFLSVQSDEINFEAFHELDKPTDNNANTERG